MLLPQLRLKASWPESGQIAFTPMTTPELKKAVQDSLPQLIAEDPLVRDFVVITNGSVIACEIKSSLSKSDMYSFDRKVAFYQKRHDRPVTRKLVISTMVDQRALPVAEALGIEVYSSPQSIPGYRYGSRDNVL